MIRTLALHSTLMCSKAAQGGGWNSTSGSSVVCCFLFKEKRCLCRKGSMVGGQSLLGQQMKAHSLPLLLYPLRQRTASSCDGCLLQTAGGTAAQRTPQVPLRQRQGRRGGGRRVCRRRGDRLRKRAPLRTTAEGAVFEVGRLEGVFGVVGAPTYKIETQSRLLD